MKYIILLSLLSLLSLLANGCGEVQPLTGQEHPETINVKVGDAFKMNIYLDADTETPPETVGPDPGEVEPTDIEELPEMGTEESCQAPYPGGPFSLEKFGIIDNMTFYDPWRDNWIELSDFYLHENYKALLLVSSAGWCGPCLSEASSLIGLYDKYHEDGLEIVYTLGNTNTPGDVPFDTSAGDTGSPDFYNDIGFMENWQNMASDGADKMINYRMYADPKREFLEYFPGHAWPLSVLVTTKDMGIRLVEEGYWSTLMENKIQLVLWNDVPNLPFE